MESRSSPFSLLSPSAPTSSSPLLRTPSTPSASLPASQLTFPRRLEKVKALAGDRAHLLHTINYNTHPDWDKEVLAITKGNGVDFIVEVGGQGTIEKSFNSIVRPSSLLLSDRD